MAEAFGVGAGIVGVLSLTIQITQVVVQFGLDWKHAPRDVTDFMRELQSLKTVLSETRTNLEDPNFAKAFQDRPSILQSELGPNTPTMNETKVSIDFCSAELERVLHELKTRDKGHRLGWDRLKGPFLAKSTRDSIDKLRRYGQLFNHMASIDAMTLAVTTWTEVKEMRREQQQWHSDEKNQAMLHWISTLSFEERQRDILSKRHPETGKWLLDQEVFKDWRNGVRGEPSVLWCPGIAGAGKSVMTSIVIEHLQQLFTEHDVSISYIYCDYKDRNTQTVVNLISSLVKQILSQQIDMPKEVKDLYAEHNNGQISLSLEEHSKLLASLSKYFRRSFILVDALDEHVISDDAERSWEMTLLDTLLNLQHQWNGSNGCTLFLTSRHSGLIQEKLAQCARLDISAASSDIELYLRSRIRNSSRFRFPVKVRDDDKLIDQIISTLVEKAQGMFLLPRLHLDRLECQTTVRDLRVALKSLPTKVDETYSDAMTRIQNQAPEYSKLAMSALSWISNTLRPLKWNELQHALAVRHGDKKMDEEALVDEILLISVSGGLITLDAQSGTIRLAHFTVEEYFKREKQAWFPNADSQIAETCLIYLSFDVFKTGPCSSPDKFETRLRQNWFLKYASRNWGRHTLRADEHIDEDIAVHFLADDRMVSCCNQAKLDRPFIPQMSRSLRTHFKPQILQSSGLHFAAQLGLLSMFKRLLERRSGVDSKDYMGQTPLTLAIIGGHVEMVKFLLDQNDVSAVFRDHNGRTPLSHAASKGHAEIVKILLARSDMIVDSRDNNGRTPLSYAAIYGLVEIVKLLVARSDMIGDSQDNDGRTPLSYVASEGHAEILKLLVARDDVSAGSRDNTGCTPLSHAASDGHVEIVKLLVARDDVIADSRDDDGRTPLSYAAQYRHDTVVKLLLDRVEVEADSRDKDRRTPLLYAVRWGHEVVVKLLLARGDVAADSRDNQGRTPLSHAAGNGSEIIMKLLLDRVDVVADSQDNDGRTPLSHAAQVGNVAVVKLLLGRIDVAADSQSNDGRTPLSFGAKWGRIEVVGLLLDRGDVAVDSRDNDGHTPLDYATNYECQGVVQLLEDRLWSSRTEDITDVDLNI